MKYISNDWMMSEGPDRRKSIAAKDCVACGILTPKYEWSTDLPRRAIPVLHAKEESLWTELFVDLIIVGQFYSMGVLAEKCTSNEYENKRWPGIFHLSCFFCMLYNTNALLGEHSNRFAMSGTASNIFYYFYAMSLFVMCFNFAPDDEYFCKDSNDLGDDSLQVGTFSGFIFSRLSFAILYLVTAYYAPTDRFWNQVCFTTWIHIFIVFYTIFAVAQQNANAIYSAVILEWVLHSFRRVGYCDKFLKFFLPHTQLGSYTIPMDIWKVQERAGVWVCMTLGEGIIALVYGTPNTHKESSFQRLISFTREQ